jgi:translation initiation factor 2B subunit (eIF-2B alpha/beta/delta family)|tara:strand:- start:344 stop:625 length:282 start_codon:yes stop_codon:yes gene_type:complete
MSNLQVVLEFIKKSEKSDINKMIDQINIRKSELRHEIKSSFSVGDIVGIDHKTMDPDKTFRITKINNKNIKVISTDPGPKNQYTVSPSLLIKK